MITASTLANLERKAPLADRVQMHDGVPLPSWIECNVTELCQRSGPARPKPKYKPCTFCPRIDPRIYPNRNKHMDLRLARKLACELRDLDYRGAVVLSGFGEPLLHPDITALVAEFHGLHVEMVTNGDRLDVMKLEALQDVGLGFMAVSCYDGPHQLPHFTAMFVAAGWRSDSYVLRDRWQGEDEDFGLMLTNRAGMATAGRQAKADPTRHCFYPAYAMMIDWNGTALLCTQDWTKGQRYGDLNTQSLLEVWRSPALHERRMALLRERTGLQPCHGCNATGTVHGAQHAEAWQSL